MSLPRRPRNRVLNNNNKNNNPIQSVGRDNANSSFKYDIYRSGDGRRRRLVRYEMYYCHVQHGQSYNIQYYNNIHSGTVDGPAKYQNIMAFSPQLPPPRIQNGFEEYTIIIYIINKSLVIRQAYTNTTITPPFVL